MMEYYSARRRNTFESVLKRWTNPRVYRTEWSKSEIWKSRKIVLMIGQQRRNRHTKQTMDMEGEEEGEGKMYGENNIETYNTICKIDSQWESAVWLRELKQGLCDRLKGGVEREMEGRSGKEGTWVYIWLTLVDVWQKTTKFCKAIILQLKILKHTHTQKGGFFSSSWVMASLH